MIIYPGCRGWPFFEKYSLSALVVKHVHINRSFLECWMNKKMGKQDTEWTYAEFPGEIFVRNEKDKKRLEKVICIFGFYKTIGLIETFDIITS